MAGIDGLQTIAVKRMLIAPGDCAGAPQIGRTEVENARQVRKVRSLLPSEQHLARANALADVTLSTHIAP